MRPHPMPNTQRTSLSLGAWQDRSRTRAERRARMARRWRIVLATAGCIVVPGSARGQHVDKPSPTMASGTLRISGSDTTGGQDFPWGPAPPGEAHPRRERGYSLRHQELRVRFDADLKRVSGTTSLEIVASDAPVSVLDVEAMNMKIAAVSDSRGQPLVYHYDERTIRIALPATLAPRASGTVSIRYSVEQPRAGVIFVAAPRVVWTQGMMRDTRYWLPTIDDVDSRPTWMVEVRCPIGEQAVATGHLDMSGAVEGQAVWRWVESDPTPIRYLTIAVGRYIRLLDAPADSVSQPSLERWALRDTRDSARAGFATATQTLQRRDSLTGFFDAPVTVEIGTRDGPRTVTVPMSGEVTRFRTELPAPPTYVDWDPAGVLQSEVTFRRSTALLIGQLEHDPHSHGRIEAARGLVDRARGTGGEIGILFSSHGPTPTMPLADTAAMGPVVRAAHSDPSVHVRAGIVEALAGAFDAPSQAALMEATHDSSPSVRASAALSLFGVPSAEARARLTELATSDPDEGVRETAKESQRMSASRRAPSPGIDESVLDTAGERSRLEMLQQLDQMPNGWDVGRGLLTDSASSRAVKQAAMRQLAIAASMHYWKSGGSRDEFVKLVEPLLASDDPSMRVAAARDLSVVNGPAAIAALEARKAVEIDALVLTEIDRSLAQVSRDNRYTGP